MCCWASLVVSAIILSNQWEGPYQDTFECGAWVPFLHGSGNHGHLPLCGSSSVCGCAQSHPTLCDPIDYSPPDSSVHGISQARILEQIAISYSSGSSRPSHPTPIPWVSSLADRFFYHWATWEAPVPPVLGSLTSYLPLSTFPVSPLFSFALLSLALVWGFVVVFNKEEQA